MINTHIYHNYRNSSSNWWICTLVGKYREKTSVASFNMLHQATHKATMPNKLYRMYTAW